jgi:hypothetical protein
LRRTRVRRSGPVQPLLPHPCSAPWARSDRRCCASHGSQPWCYAISAGRSSP